MTKKILTRLRFPAKTVASVSHLIAEHMFHYESAWSDAAVRRFIVRTGTECIDDLFDLRLADIYGMKRSPVRMHDSAVGKNLVELKKRIEAVQKENSALSLKDLAVSGDDLAEAGIPRGKEMGRVLKELFDTVLDDPKENTKEKLLAIARNIYRKDEKDDVK